MARCGCQGAGSTTCEAIVRCVAAVLGPGLAFTNGRIQTRISRDGGNCLRYGSDQGLYAPCDGGGGGGGGGRTVEGLPDQVFGGIGGGAGLVMAYGSPYAVEYAVANQIDIIAHQSWALSDQIAAWGPMAPQRPVNEWARTSATMQGRLLTSEEYTALEANPGVPGGNPTGRYSGAPEAILTPDGGWYGFGQRPYAPMLTTDLLNLVRARTVVMIANASAANQDTAANIQAILTTQAQDWVIADVPFNQLPVVPLFLEASIPHVSVSIAGNTDVTPQQVLDTGATWVRINSSQDPARIESFVDAGLQVIAGYTGRQTIAAAMLDLGVRGVMSNDPVYQRGVLGEPWLKYRVPHMSFQTKQTEVGGLTQRTDQGQIPDGRGYAKETEYGRFFNAQFNWAGTTARRWNNQLLGKFCPISDPTEYTLTMQTHVDQVTLPTSDTPKLGWVIANDNDLDISHPVTGADNPNRHGYACFIRVGSGTSNGRLEIGVFSAGGAYTSLATSATQQPVVGNVWFDLEVQVTGDTITLRRTDTTPYEVTVTNTDWRGPYAYHVWEDHTDGAAGSFAHGYRDNGIVSGNPGGPDWAVLEINYETWEAMAAENPTWGDLEAISA